VSRTMFSAQFLVHFLSDGGDRGLRLRVIILLRQYGFDVCLVCACDELTASL